MTNRCDELDEIADGKDLDEMRQGREAIES
jgi:hypothetical protein